jgi:gliding motility-associated-like protein
MIGQQTEVSVTGANTYTWSPGDHVSISPTGTTILSPIQNTHYIVTGYDSLGCSNTTTVDVFVEMSGFIPSLFTPNSDGKNDQLKVYGVNLVNGFSLKIFNRDGNVVYSTRNLTEALQQGWDGTNNGVQQPNGVYYWKIDGAVASGEKLLLNGKKEGSILLLR